MSAGPGTIDAQLDRAVEVQALFREVNERVREISANHVTLTEFVCECADEHCFEPVGLRLDEYDGVRASPIRFAIAPGHLIADGETAVTRGRRFWIVEKQSGASADGAMRRDARLSDPRDPG